MVSRNFSITINAPRETVWGILWNDKTYRVWTSVFSPGSYAVSDWKEKSRIHFLDSNGSGIFSEIDKMDPPQYVSFTHLGVVKEGEEQQFDTETENWTGAKETYQLEETDGQTKLTVERDITDEHKDFFNDTFPKALEKVKELAEAAV